VKPVRSRWQHSPAPWIPATGRRSDAGRAHPPPSIRSALALARGLLFWSLAESLAMLGAWRRRHRYRRDLTRLMRTGPHLIEDIGLLRKHAAREAAKPFWRQ
jgi:uncharacterized protein YjiS (DUF1127 family)